MPKGVNIVKMIKMCQYVEYISAKFIFGEQHLQTGIFFAITPSFLQVCKFGKPPTS
jgi:hypothetical protein